VIGAFPTSAGWTTLRLASGPDDGPLMLLESEGVCPGDPDGRLTRLDTIESAEEALVRARRRLAAGWRVHGRETLADASAARRARRQPAAPAPVPAHDDGLLPTALARAAIAHACSASPASRSVCSPTRCPAAEVALACYLRDGAPAPRRAAIGRAPTPSRL
jgi:hypothetical protein